MFIYTLLNPRLESLLHFEVWYLQHHGSNDFMTFAEWNSSAFFFSPTYRHDQVWVSLHLSSWLWFKVGFYVCVTGHDPIFGDDRFHICVSLKTPPTRSRDFLKDNGPPRGSAQGRIRAPHHLRRASVKWFKSDLLESKPWRALSGLLHFW